MVNGILRLAPNAKVGHIGLYRDPVTMDPVEYYCKLPCDAEERDLIVVDPMLATGGSASMAITFLKQRGCQRIKFMCLVAAKQGVEKLMSDHPDVDIFAAAYDLELNDHCNRPGLATPATGYSGQSKGSFPIVRKGMGARARFLALYFYSPI